MIYLNPISADSRFRPEALDREFITDKTKKLHWRKNIHGTNHYTDFIDSIRSRQQANAEIRIGARSTALCVVTNMAHKLGRGLDWDPEKFVVTGDPDAAKMDARPLREPWHL